MNEMKAYFFDLDDTLYDQLDPFRNAVQSAMSYRSPIPFAEVFKRVREYSDLLWDKYCSGELSLEKLREKRLVEAFQDFDYVLTHEEANRIQEQYKVEQGNIQLFNGASQYLHSLMDQGYVLGMITNGPVEHQLKKIHTLQLESYISEERMFISDAVGIAKPNKDIFTYVSNRIGISPHNCYYVGDSWTNDVVPSLEAGWHSIWFNFRRRAPETEHQPDTIIYGY